MTLSASLVGRTGGRALVALLDVEEAVDSAGHSADPHALSVGQHPPPKLAGQDLKPVLQVSVPCDVVLVLVMELLSDVVELEDSAVDVVDTSLLVVGLALVEVVVLVLVVGVAGGRVVVSVIVLLTMPGASQFCSQSSSSDGDGTYSQHPGKYNPEYSSRRCRSPGNWYSQRRCCNSRRHQSMCSLPDSSPHHPDQCPRL